MNTLGIGIGLRFNVTLEEPGEPVAPTPDYLVTDEGERLVTDEGEILIWD